MKIANKRAWNDYDGVACDDPQGALQWSLFMQSWQWCREAEMV
jgi:hypothetical protein